MNNGEDITIEVCPQPWAESATSWKLLTEQGETAGSWSNAVWFPKKCCKLDTTYGLLTLPLWLYHKKFPDENRGV